MPSALPIESVNHLARQTKRLEEMRAFYRDVLGFREIERPNFNFPGAWLFNYGLQIHLIVDDQANNRTGGEISTRAAHLALHVLDTNEVERLLNAHHIPFVKNYVADRNVTQIFFHDPDGNHIEIGCYPPVPAFATV